jgi:hypothetical protein
MPSSPYGGHGQSGRMHDGVEPPCSILWWRALATKSSQGRGRLARQRPGTAAQSLPAAITSHSTVPAGRATQPHFGCRNRQDIDVGAREARWECGLAGVVWYQHETLAETCRRNRLVCAEGSRDARVEVGLEGKRAGCGVGTDSEPLTCGRSTSARRKLCISMYAEQSKRSITS